MELPPFGVLVCHGGRKVPAFLLVLVFAPYDLVVMRRMKIKDLPNWPPEPGGAFNGSYKSGEIRRRYHRLR